MTVRSKKLRWTFAATVGLLSVGLSGCETVSSTIFPSAPSSPSAAAVPSTIVSAPQAGTSQYLPVAVTAGTPTATTAGQTIGAVRNNLVSLQGQLSSRNIALSNVRQGWTQDVASYRVNKNQVLRPPVQGDTKTALTQGDAALKRLMQHTARLSKEMEGFAQGNADANGLMSRLESVKPDGDADRDQLNTLRSEVMQTSTGLDTLINSLSNEAGQNNAFIAKERAALASLSQQYASSPAVRATEGGPTIATPASVQPMAAVAGATKPSPTKPAFVTIKFDRPSVTYRDALSAALKQALARRPDAGFDVVGVTNRDGKEFEELVKARAEDVARTMMELNVPASRIGIDSMRVKAAASDEVRIFVR